MGVVLGIFRNRFLYGQDSGVLRIGRLKKIKANSAMRYSTRNTALKQNVRNLKQNMTLAEQKMWHHLRGKRLNGIKFRRQQTIGGYIVDFVSMEHRLIIELVGVQLSDQIEYDERRTAFLNAQGYRVSRFWNNEVLQQTEAVLEKIIEMCGGK